MSSETEGNGNGKGAFWKVVSIVALALLMWIGAQLLIIPTHGYRLDAHETRISANETRIGDVEKTQADLKSVRAETAELLGLLREAKFKALTPPRHVK